MPAMPAMRVTFRTFRGTITTFEELFSQAANFATGVGKDRLINISHSEDWNHGVVTVWYWTNEPAPVPQHLEYRQGSVGPVGPVGPPW